jgi:putative transposase
VRLHFITPGRHTRSAYIESFNGKLSPECLLQHWFTSLAEAREIVAA